MSEKVATAQASSKESKRSGFTGTHLTAIVVGLAAAVFVLCETIWRDQINNYVFEARVGVHSPVVPFVATALYLIMLLVLPKIMKNRDPVDLKLLPIVHNIILSSGSLLVTVTILREVAKLVPVYGIEGLNCDSAKVQPTTPLYFWFVVFYLSKMYEFIDTAILILRKKPLIFLHTYHHVITLWLCWVCLDDRLSMQWLCTVANTIVHVVMYYFYGCNALKIDVWWKKYVTTLQIVQFIMDITGNVSWAYYTIIENRVCSGSWFGFWFGMSVLASFLVLFIDFYRKSYTKKRAVKKE